MIARCRGEIGPEADRHTRTATNEASTQTEPARESRDAATQYDEPVAAGVAALFPVESAGLSSTDGLARGRGPVWAAYSLGQPLVRSSTPIIVIEDVDRDDDDDDDDDDEAIQPNANRRTRVLVRQMPKWLDDFECE